MAKNKSPQINVENFSCSRLLKIKFNDKIHICLKQDHIIGFKTFETEEGLHGIKIYTTNRPVIMKYGNEFLMNAVLNILDN